MINKKRIGGKSKIDRVGAIQRCDEMKKKNVSLSPFHYSVHFFSFSLSDTVLSHARTRVSNMTYQLVDLPMNSLPGVVPRAKAIPSIAPKICAMRYMTNLRILRWPVIKD